ncbi:enoyl-CoA hydratase/isomerase family protein [Oceanibium sediminis]|uniref:enoyl-CoA hydratase/isomerase family protein n=1 Tax=Oceanibium sediminis TaxID=2026339 RepID=UPI000DD3F9DC|nr:enoyl-CoA hydratase/isomerase family protein [Oceanibium sediminis]
MSDILIRKSGRIGHVTLNRPKALNALTYTMALELEAALDAWAGDDEIACVLIDAAGERAFCAGGDLQKMYDTATAGDFDYGRQFWRDEYRLNAKIFAFPKPYIALMQGFTMGGGVGISCHGSHRVVGDSSRIAMPECSVGLVPDVGGSWLLGKAPGRLGEYLGMTGARMDASDALLAGFADYYIPEDRWRELTEALIETGDWSVIDSMASDPPDGKLMALRDTIDRDFAGATAQDILRGLGEGAFADEVRGALARNSPLSVACSVELIRRVRAFETLEPALGMEYRFTSRSASEGDFIEGIRAAIIDKDRAPKWQHRSLDDVPGVAVSHMLAPLGADALNL